jgi:pimeloyl-ACP methyl ester carboxylesterase
VAAPWAVLGISLGAMVALEWCAGHPRDFARAVLLNTSAGGVSPPPRRFHPRNLGPVLRIAWARDPRARERVVLRMTSAGAGERAALLDAWALFAAEAPMTGWNRARQLLAAAAFRAPRALPVPALFLASRGDRIVHHSCGDGLGRRYGAPVALHAAAGHDLTLDDPAWVAERIAVWVDGG